VNVHHFDLLLMPVPNRHFRHLSDVRDLAARFVVGRARYDSLFIGFL
jgi:hypothetical protein